MVIQIARLNEQLGTLMEQRSLIHDEINDYKAVLHPIRRIPGDILRSIFMMLVNEDLESFSCETSLDLNYMPWKLTKVSREWRKMEECSIALRGSGLPIAFTSHVQKRSILIFVHVAD